MGASYADTLEISSVLLQCVEDAERLGELTKGLCIQMGEKKEMQLNWHCCCARGFKDRDENCWSV